MLTIPGESDGCRERHLNSRYKGKSRLRVADLECVTWRDKLTLYVLQYTTELASNVTLSSL